MNNVRVRWLVPAWIAVLCSGVALAGDPPSDVGFEAPFEARQRMTDLLSAIGSGNPSELAAQAVALADDWPDALMPVKDGALPIAASMQRAFANAGLEGIWLDVLGKAGEKALQAAGRNPEALRRILAVYKGTAAERQAARLLADMAWDRGNLGRFLDLSVLAGDRADAQRAQRIAFAERSDVPSGDLLPPTLSNLHAVWSLELPAPALARRTRSADANTQRQARVVSARGIAAISDGTRLLLVEVITGRLIATHQLNSSGESMPWIRPVVTANGFVILSASARGRELLSVRDDGTIAWRVPIDSGFAYSAPACKGSEVALLSMNSSGDQISYALTVVNAETGLLRWQRTVSRTATDGMWQYGRANEVENLAVAAYRGGWLTVQSNGSVFFVDGDGRPRRQWTYAPIQREEMWQRSSDTTLTTRSATIMTDGLQAVITPVDNQVTLILGDNGVLRSYRGDGANGRVIAVHGGGALLAGRRLIRVDLSTLKATTSPSTTFKGMVTSYVSPERVVVVDQSNISMIDPKTGAPIDGSRPTLASQRGVTGMTAGCAEGFMLQIAPDRIVGFADHQFIGERLAQDMQRNPKDPAPAMALGRIAIAKGDDVAALQALQIALDRGQKAAEPLIVGIHRRSLERDLGTARFSETLDKIRSHVEASEMAWWSVRDASVRGNREQARALAAAVSAQSDSELLRPEGVSVFVHASMQAVLGTPAWAQPSATMAAPMRVTPAGWSVRNLFGGSVVQHDLLLSYGEGLLQARRVSDAAVQWSVGVGVARLGIQEMIGDRQLQAQPLGDLDLDAVPDAAPEKQVDLQRPVTIRVFEGTASAQAGMKTGDVLVSFNNRPVKEFDADLRQQVMALAPATPFTAQVRRNGAIIAVNGRLGGVEVAPIAVGPRTVLVRNTMAIGQGADPERYVFALDARSGAELFRMVMPMRRDVDVPWFATLIDDLAVLIDGADLVGFDCHPAPGASRERWRISGGASSGDPQLINGHVLWVPDATSNRGVLMDPRTGQRIAMLPIENDATPHVSGVLAATLSNERMIRLWDLAQGTLLWTGSIACERILGMTGDSIVAIERASGQLVVIDRASGQPRRTLADWSGFTVFAGSFANQIVLTARREGQLHAIGLDVRSGSIAWSIPVPALCEVADISSNSHGACLTLRSFDQLQVMRLDPSGAMLGAISMPIDDTVANSRWMPLSNGMLHLNSRMVTAWTVPAPSAPAALRLAAGMTAAATAAARVFASEKGPWLPLAQCGGYRVTAMTLPDQRRALLVAVRGPVANRLRFHLSDSTESIDASGTFLTFSGEGNKPMLAGGLALSWSLLHYEAIDDDIHLMVIAVPVATPGVAPRLRLRAIGGADDTHAPWWMLTAATPVEIKP